MGSKLYLSSATTEFLSKPLFSISETEVSFLSILVFLTIVLLAMTSSLVVQTVLKKTLREKFESKKGTLTALLRLLHYSVCLIGIAIAMEIIGIKISSLFAAGAVFALAIGFAMKNIIQNFVSGVILLLERSIKPGDILEVEGNVVKVIDMGIRTTVVRTWQEEEIIMPNSIFSQTPVKNYTLRDNKFRIAAKIGVPYNCDLQKVIDSLEETAENISWRDQNMEPRVQIVEFANSSITLRVNIGIDNPWEQRRLLSDLHKEIWFSLQNANITIPFPQMDVHLDYKIS